MDTTRQTCACFLKFELVAAFPAAKNPYQIISNATFVAASDAAPTHFNIKSNISSKQNINPIS